MTRRPIPVAWGLLLAAAAPAAAQDFVGPAAAGPAPASSAFLDTGLAPAVGFPRLDAAATRWFGLAELATRAVAAGIARRSLRLAAGLSQTGETDIGWNAIGLACGAARRSGGAGLRAVARRDRAAAAPSVLGPGVGIEAGAGAWIAAGRGVTLWASAPQMWTRGAPPPLARGLEVGGALAAADLELWLARSGPGGEAGTERAAGVALAAGPWSVWLAARDRPLRGTLGVAVHARRVRAAVAVDSHPALPETVKLAVGIGPPVGEP